MSHLSNVLRGVAIGIANIIPGVSGGTMALLLGIFERLINAVRGIGVGTLKALFGGKAKMVAELKRIDAMFLCTIALGAVIAVVGTAKIMPYFLTHQHDPTFGFFFGLILLSIAVPFKLIKKHSVGTWLSCIAGIAAVVALTLAMSGQERLDNAKKKAALKAARAQIGKTVTKEGAAAPVAPKPDLDPKKLFFFFIAGAIAISAMILPGISGSFMLLLMGVYFDVLATINALVAALKDRDIGAMIGPGALLGVLAIGCVVGLLLFTRLINAALNKFHDATMAFLTGLVAGSLLAIWPFKSFEMVGERRVDLDNVLPTSFGSNEILTVGAVIVGAVIVFVFIKLESRKPATT